MRLPRDLSGADLIKLLEKFSYHSTRQIGSHVRVTSALKGEHHLTVPLHNNLRLGTLNAILTDVAEHFGISKSDLMKRLFG